MYKTFNGWKLAGRVVAAGERGCYRNEYGDMMFHRSKTIKRGSVETIRVYRDEVGRFIRKETRIVQNCI